MAADRSGSNRLDAEALPVSAEVVLPADPEGLNYRLKDVGAVRSRKA